MADHPELVAEIPKVEKLTVQERLEYAKKRRKQQLRRWDREKDSENGPPPRKKKLSAKPVTFQPQFMLLDAATRDDVDEVKSMLKNGVDANICNDDGLTALHQASIDGCEEIIDILLENGACLDSVDRELWTPLHAAAACGNDDIVEYLLDQGANIVAINADGNMPIDLVDEENEELKEILQAEMEEQGYTAQRLEELKDLQEQQMLADIKAKFEEDDDFDIDILNEQSATLVHIATANGYEDVLEFLLEQGASVDIADKDGWQPIHAAAVWGNEASVELLVENGAELDAKTNNGDTPLTLCEDPELQQFLVDLKNKVKTNKAKSSKRKRSNSRSLSVKRTSLKDKITISQNEAKAEAILRVHPQLAFLLPKGTEFKNGEIKPIDTVPAATEGEATANSTTSNTTRQGDLDNTDPSAPVTDSNATPNRASSLNRGKRIEDVGNVGGPTSSLGRQTNNFENRVRESVGIPVQKKSSLNRGRQKVEIDIGEKENVDPVQSNKSSVTQVKTKDQEGRDSGEKTTVMEKKSSLKITVKTRTSTSDDKKEEKPPIETKPDVTMDTKEVIDKLPYDKHPRTRQQEPDVTIGTQHMHDISVAKSTKGQPDVTMVTKPSTLPRIASNSRSGALPESGNLETRSSSDINIAARSNRMPGQRTPGNFTQSSSDANTINKTPGVNYDHNTPPKSTKTRHAPAPPMTRSSGSLSRSHEPADTSGYPDSFSKRSRASRENIMDVVATGRLASPSKTVSPTDVNLEPATSPAQNQQQPNKQPQPNKQQQPNKQPQPNKQQQPNKQPQPNKQQPQPNKQTTNHSSTPKPPENNANKPTQPLQQKEPSNTQPNNSTLPTQTQQQQKPVQMREQQPNKPLHSRESYRRRSSSEALATINSVPVKDDDKQEKKTCCILM